MNSKLHRRLPAVVLVTALAVSAAIAGIGIFDHLFEIDGNAVSDGTADDWNTVLLGGGGGSIADTGVIVDLPELGSGPDDIFIGGGSKDTNDLDQWAFTTGNVPDKDNLTNAYAAAYINPFDIGEHKAGDLIIFFGADRFANNGDAQIGFWFLQNDIEEDPVTGTFAGVHADDDILVLSDFTQGGGVSTVRIFAWKGDGTGSHGTLDDITAQAAGLAFAIVNDMAVAAPWPYLFKFAAPPDTFPEGTFFEGGINLTQLSPGSTCFATFLAETRTSQSVTSQLKDLVLHELAVCDLSVSKSVAPEQVCAQSPDVVYSYEVCNSGGIPLTVTLVDDNGTPDDPFDDIDVGMGSFLLGPGECKDFQLPLTLVVPLVTPATITNTVTATGTAGSTSVTKTATASVDVFDCAIEVTKTCEDASGPGQPIQFSGTVCNTGQVPLLDVTVVDDHAGQVLSVDELAPGECQNYSGSYVPNTNPSTNTVVASGTALGIPVSDTAKATCIVICEPDIQVTADCLDATAPGQPIHIMGQVCNTGNATLTNVTVVNSLAGTLLGPIVLAPGQCQNFAGSYVPATSPSASTTTATGTAEEICHFEQVSDSTETVCVVPCDPCIAVTVDCADADAAGGRIEISGSVTNCGNTNLSGVTVVDDQAGLVFGPANLAPGQTANFTGSYVPSVAPGQCSTNTATATGNPDAICGLPPVTDTDSSTCCVPDAGEGCTPGFWKNHPELWDQPSDPIAMMAGFTTSTSFNAFFGLTPAQSGFPDSLTMLGALRTGGGGGAKLARHGVAALLNLAAGLGYELPPGIGSAMELGLAIQMAYLTGIFEPLATQLADANEAGCPF